MWMNIKMIFILLGATQIAFHESFCTSLSSKQTFFYCSSCGVQVSAKEVLAMHGNLKKVLCQRCYVFLRGKEGEGDQGQAVSGISLPLSSTVEVCDAATQFSVDGQGDHFYGNPDARRIIDEEMWPVSVGDWKKPPRVLVGGSRRKVVIRKKPKKKTKISSPLHSVAAGALSAVSSIPLGMWLYSFAQRPEIQPHSELHVIHDRQLFVCCSERPARELWCQGPRAVVVTDDGFTYFDVSQDKRLFFARKQDLEAYAAQQGFAHEFKVVLQEPHILDSEKKPAGLDEIFAKHDAIMRKAFDDYEAEVKRIDKETEEKYEAEMRVILQQVPAMTLAKSD